MFTGIIEEIGQIRSVSKNRVSATFTIKAHGILQDVAVGDSIAVNGICLTVTGYTKDSFTVDMMHETFDRTCACAWRRGTEVSLERAMAAGGRFGGHIVSGHIDGTGTISGIRQDDNAVWYEIAADPGILRYVVEKGSVAIDGISLTVASVGKDRFSVSTIPHTRNVTTLSERKVGDKVNLENDIVGKYVERFLIGDRTGLTYGDATAISAPGIMRAGRAAGGSAPGSMAGGSRVTEQLLAENGFL